MAVIMPSPVFRWFIPATGSTGLVPAAGYKAKFYSAGTSTAKAIYDATGTIYPSPANTAILDAQGKADIRLGAGNYKLVVTDSLDSPVYTQDNIAGGNTFGTGFVNTVISSGTDGLKDADSTANTFVWCAGYYTIGDGGHGFFYNKTSSTADDTGYVIASTFDATKRWFRVPDEDDCVRAQSFGYIGTTAANYSNNLLAAAAYCTSYNKTLKIGPGTAATISNGSFTTLSLYANNVIFEAGSMLTASGALIQLDLYAITTGTAEQHFTGFTHVYLRPTQVNENPEWFGAALGSGDNTAAFALWLASLPNGGAFTLPPGTWTVANSAAFPYPTVPLTLLGTVHGTAGGDIPPGLYLPNASQIRLNKLLFKDGGGIASAASGNIALIGSIASAITTTAGNAINSGAGLTAATGATIGGGVSAGNGASGGKITTQAGTSAHRYTAGGQYSAVLNGSGVSTSGTAETDLFSTTIYANSLDTDTDKMVLRAGGGMVTSGHVNRRFRVLLGAKVLFDGTIINGGAGTATLSKWSLIVEFWRSGTADCYAIGTLSTDMSDTGSSTDQSSVAYYAFNTPLSWGSDQTIKVAATASGSGSITQYLMSLDIFPAP